MSWYIRGRSYACCSCSVGCPCASGGSETAGSVGCCAVQIMDIDEGMVEGTDVSRTKVAAVVDWPGAMMAGNGRGRLYFDVETSPEQQAMLNALLGGQLGGVFRRMPSLVPHALPPIVAPIRPSLTPGAACVQVGEFGQALIKELRGPGGELQRLDGPGGFREDLALAVGHGSWWRDPDLRHWQGGGYAEQKTFHFAG